MYQFAAAAGQQAMHDYELAVFVAAPQVLVNMTIKSSLLIVACAFALLLSGCAQSVCFKSVEATSGQPLPGVSVSMMQFDNQIFAPKHLGPVNLPPSDENGLTKVSAHRSWWTKQFVFSRPGYITVYGDYGATEGDVFWLGTPESYDTYPRSNYFGMFSLKANAEQAVKSNGCFVIRMSPSDPKTQTVPAGE